MKDLLQPLNKIPGVIGSMVITQDGIMVADATGPELREDAVAALSSALTMTLKRSLETLGSTGGSDEMVLNAEKGKLLFLDLGQAYLVVITRPNLRLETGMVEVRGIANKLRERCLMSSGSTATHSSY
ncbi:MAG: roadblock/LC7 domain-containing protein [Planctomycetota bacterium]